MGVDFLITRGGGGTNNHPPPRQAVPAVPFVSGHRYYVPEEFLTLPDSETAFWKRIAEIKSVQFAFSWQGIVYDRSSGSPQSYPKCLNATFICTMSWLLFETFGSIIAEVPQDCEMKNAGRDVS